MVSRGPGATNGSIALHVAEQDAAPVVHIIGQVARHERGLTLGAIYAADGLRVATTAQEGSLRFNSDGDGLERGGR